MTDFKVIYKFVTCTWMADFLLISKFITCTWTADFLVSKFMTFT